MKLQVATREKVKLRLNLSGPSGSGKTMSALRMAYGITNKWETIAVIDTENKSSALYSHLGKFNILDLTPPYSPERYNEAIDECVKSGIELIIIDSSSHEWEGEGGCLDLNEKLAAAKYRGNTWSAWNEITPRHDSFVNKVVQCPTHVITCTRSKMETIQTEDKKIKKVGMKDIQRSGWEYELTVSLTIDRDSHMAIASKDRTNVFESMPPFIITEDTGRLIKAWCESGIDAVPPIDPAAEAIASMYLCKNADEVKQLWSGNKPLQTNPAFLAAKNIMKLKYTSDVKNEDVYSELHGVQLGAKEGEQ